MYEEYDLSYSYGTIFWSDNVNKLDLYIPCLSCDASVVEWKLTELDIDTSFDKSRILTQAMTQNDLWNQWISM